MTDSLNSPGIAARIDRLIRRVEDLERRLRARSTDRPADAEPLEAPFFHGGPLSTTTSGRWYPRRTATLSQVWCSLDTAGSTSTVVTVYVNGGSQGTVTIPGSANTGSATFDDVLVADADYLTVAATTVGTGAEDLTVQARLS